MPSLINQTVGYYENGDPVYAGANYLVALPTTQLGTRVLKPLVLYVTGVETNYENADSLFSKTVRALQQNVELYAVFTPNSDRLTVLVASDTTPQDNTTDEEDNNRNAYLEEVLSAAGVTAEVWNATINGSSLNWND